MKKLNKETIAEFIISIKDNGYKDCDKVVVFFNKQSEEFRGGELYLCYGEDGEDLAPEENEIEVLEILEPQYDIDEDWESIDEVINALSIEDVEYEENTELPIALLNTSILTTEGEYSLRDISLGEAKEIIDNKELDSAIGHQSTAEIMTTLLDVDVAVNRQQFKQEVGQKALVFKLNGRPEEGKILSLEDIKSIGYKFQLLTRTK